MQRKPLPERTAANLFPPNLDRLYFENGAKHPFRPLAQAFTPVNAWWLAEAALLAYAEEPFAREQFAKAGLTSVTLLSNSGTQCYVAEHPEFVIAAFRGTQVPKPGDHPDRIRLLQEIVSDVESDVAFRLVESGQGGCVHSGFKDALDGIWAELRGRLLDHARARQPIWMTGHSLGAALATLAADRLGGVQGLYTFGSPAVGDRAFANDFHVNAYRFVHHRDVVARVPPFGWYDQERTKRGDYVRVGAPKYIDENGLLWDSERATGPLGGSLQDVGRSVVSQAAHVRLGGLLDIAREPFDDHAPLLYAVAVWNLYVDSRT